MFSVSTFITILSPLRMNWSKNKKKLKRKGQVPLPHLHKTQNDVVAGDRLVRTNTIARRQFQLILLH